MKEASAFFGKFRDSMLGGLNTCAIGQIETFDAATMKADVLLLPDKVDLIKSVPVATIMAGGFYVRVPYAKGDMVVIVFAQREIDGIMYGGGSASGRMLSVDDAIVIGGITAFTSPIPADDAGNLVMGTLNGSGKLTIAPDGLITIKGKNTTQSW